MTKSLGDGCSFFQGVAGLAAARTYVEQEALLGQPAKPRDE